MPEAVSPPPTNSDPSTYWQSTVERNPYSPPLADLRVEKPQVVDVPAAIQKKIKTGWQAGIFSGALTLIFTLVAIFGEDVTGFMDIWSLVDVGLIFGLAFGIYKKSRTAGTIMFVYFLASKLLILAETGRFQGGLLSLLFLYFFFQAMMGTFQYHAHAARATRP